MQITERFNNLAQWQKILLASLMAFIVTLSMFAPGKSYAATTIPLPSGVSSSAKYIQVKHPGASLGVSGTAYTLVLNSPDTQRFYVSGSRNAVTISGSGTITTYSSSDGGKTWNPGNTVTVSGSWYWVDALNGTVGDVTTSDGYSVVNQTLTVYVGSSGSTVFSQPLTPKPAQLAGVQDLPKAILTPLTTGGILGLGLTILAIMLGVSLVPRLIRLFSH